MLNLFYDNNTGLHGYTNQKGETIILALYEVAEDFKHGLALVGDGVHYGVINERGEIVVPISYDQIWSSNTYIQAQKEKVFFLLSAVGEVLLELHDIVYWHFPEAELIRIKRTSGWGAVNLAGEEIIPAQYQSLGPYRNGRLSYYEQGKWGWLDQGGKIKMPAQFEQLGYWDDQLWWGLINDRYILYNLADEIVQDQGWLRIVEPGIQGAAVKTKAGWQFIDNNFNPTLKFPAIYDWVAFFSEGLAAVKRNGKWGFINSDLVEVIPPIYQNVSSFSEGLAWAETADGTGFINMRGTVVIPFIYQSAGSFKNGQASVTDVYCHYQIDQSGKQVSEAESRWD